MFENIRADMERYKEVGGWHRSLGFWVTATYRFGHWANGIERPVLRRALCTVHTALSLPWSFVKGADLPRETKIGPGLLLPHPQNILIPPGTELGARCTVFHDVTLGHGSTNGVPRLGDDVVVFAGAKVLGGVCVGNAAEIGANAVVVRDVDAGCVVPSPLVRAIPSATVTSLREGHVRPRSSGDHR